MTDADVVDVITSALVLATKLSAPLLIASLLIGLVMSLLQAVFQLQDQVFAMVPRLLVGALVVGLTAAWGLRLAVDFTVELISSVPTMVNS